MRSSFRVDPPTGLVLLEGQGPLDFEAWATTVSAALADPAYRQGARFLSDRRRMTPGQSLGFVEQIVDFCRVRAAELGDARWAVVSAPEGAFYGVARIGEALAAARTRVKVHAFTDLDEALQWLLGAFEEPEVARLRSWVDTGPTV